MASSICTANSRVGVKISERTAFRCGDLLWESRSSMGSTKAAVLPVLVWAQAIMSRPSITAGMARD
ncbi:MAG: hypothetical protein BWY71_01185 [Planctomycetes bacterium ADurb.Bin412]|nr:MAG: hypothetical protein BWY71_01185 [Planctomycetes bacterium ADurb.Bin412]